jgi:GDP-L-fucose synthase
MPTNLYGPHDNFHLNNSHVVPALIRRFHEALTLDKKDVTIWGSGNPMREFLHVDDMASACKYVMDLDELTYKNNTEEMLSHINVGTGNDCTIRELSELIADVIGYRGEIKFDISKPDGTPRKLLDVTRLTRLGWHAGINLRNGLSDTYKWFLNNQDRFRG